LFLLLVGSASINPLAICSICCNTAYRWFAVTLMIVKPGAWQ